MRMFIDDLASKDGEDYAAVMPMPNGYTVVIIRTMQEGLPEAVTRSLFDIGLCIEVASEDKFIDEEHLLTPVDVARKMRQWFELPSLQS